MRTLFILTIACAVAASPALAGPDEDLLKTAAKVKGNVDLLHTFKTYALEGTWKSYGGSGYSKFDVWITFQRPNKYAELIKDHFDIPSGEIVVGHQGVSYKNKAVRALAPFEVKNSLDAMAEIDLLWQIREGKITLTPKGEETIEVLDLDDKIKAPCRKYERVKDKNTYTYYFLATACELDHEVGTLVRTASHTVDRLGIERDRYVDYLEYEEFSGVQFALTQNTYELMEKPGRKGTYQLIMKLGVDNIALDEEIDAADFALPPVPFKGADLAALGKDAPAALKGRDPNLAELAVNALTAHGAKALTLLKGWKTGADLTLRHYASIVALRAGLLDEVDPSFLATSAKAKADKASSSSQTQGVEVHALGHAGYRVSASGRIAILDAPQQRGLFDITEPAVGPNSFAGANVFIFSSARQSCFDAALVKAAQARTGAVIVAPKTVVELLAKEGVRMEKIMEVTPEEGKTKTVEVAGLKITALGTKSFKAVHNAYLIDWGSMKTMHMGSTWEYEKLPVDFAKGARLAFLPLAKLESKAHEYFEKIGTIRYYIPTHFGESPGSFRKVRDKTSDYAKTVFILPNDKVKF